MPILDTRRVQLEVLRQQPDVQSSTIATITQHLDGEDAVVAARYQADAEREHLAALKAQTSTAVVAELEAVPAEARAWLDAQVLNLPEAPEPYALTILDEITLRDGGPAELSGLVERSGGHPTLKPAIERRLEQLHRQPLYRDKAFQMLVRLRSPRAVPDWTTRLRDLELAAQRRQVLRKDAILRAAAVVGIQPSELLRAAKRAALMATE